MRIFFLQLFLSFWLATIAIFVGASIFFPGDAPQSPDGMHALIMSSAQHSLSVALQDYQLHGCAAASLADPSILLADAQGIPICGKSLSPLEKDVLRQSIARHTWTGVKTGTQWIHAVPMTNASNKEWFLLLRSPVSQHVWFPPFPKSALPVSIVVTFLFAYLLTRPLRSLSKAFRTFTAGDLDTRLPVTGPSRLGQFDSADMRTLMADFNSMADRVTELIDAQKMLIRDISHELRSPLARLCMAIELAREDSGSDQSVFDHMEQEAEKVNALIGEMLTLSLLESLRQAPRADSIDMRVLIEELLDSANFEAHARGCQINFRTTATETRITGQPEMLSRAVENILRNAIRYTPPDGLIEVLLSDMTFTEAQAAQLETGGLKIAIRDTGPGIPLDHMSQIFRPFYRVDMARSESSGGFGVGLAIAERAIHLHGGKIAASNRPTGGLSVEMLIPRAHDSFEQTGLDAPVG